MYTSFVILHFYLCTIVEKTIYDANSARKRHHTVRRENKNKC